MSKFRIPRKVKKTMSKEDVKLRKHLEFLILNNCLSDFKMKVSKGRISVKIIPISAPKFINVQLSTSSL